MATLPCHGIILANPVSGLQSRFKSNIFVRAHFKWLANIIYVSAHSKQVNRNFLGKPRGPLPLAALRGTGIWTQPS